MNLITRDSGGGVSEKFKANVKIFSRNCDSTAEIRTRAARLRKVEKRDLNIKRERENNRGNDRSLSSRQIVTTHTHTSSNFPTHDEDDESLGQQLTSSLSSRYEVNNSHTHTHDESSEIQSQ